ncbi:MAG: winged helix-turn-helix domain-containing protein [Bryobacteraceae bacterium]
MSAYRLGVFTLDLARRQARAGGETVALGFRQFEVLRILVEAGGQIVDRESLHQQLWPGAIVDETSLNKCISQVRKALAEHDPDTEYLETIPRRGYRLAVPAAACGVEAPAPWWTPARRAAAGILMAAVAGWAGWTGWQRMAQRESAESIVARGRELSDSGEHARAVAAFKRALEIEPRNGRIYNEMAFSLHRLNDAETHQTAAIDAARKSVELDPRCGPCHGTLAFLLYYHAWEWEGAKEHYRRSLELEPDKPAVLTSYAYLLAATGRTREALRAVDRAVELHPFEPGPRAVRAGILYVSRRYEEAIAAADSAIALDRKRVDAWDYRSRAQLRLGRIDEGVRSQVAARYRDHAGAVGQAVAEGGGEAGLRKLLEVTGSWRDRRIYCWRRADWRAALGDDSGALDELEEAVRIRNVNLMLVAVDPAYEHLHGEPRFQEILKTMGLEGVPRLTSQESSRR